MDYKRKNPNAAQRIRRFRRDEDGSFTIEFVIWMPIFAILLAIVLNLSMVFYYESQMLRVAQDATRAVSLGKFDGDENKSADVLAEEYIAAQLSFIDAPLVIDTQIKTQGSVVVAQTLVTANADQLMPFSLMSGAFANIPVGVSTQFLMEY